MSHIVYILKTQQQYIWPSVYSHQLNLLPFQRVCCLKRKKVVGKEVKYAILPLYCGHKPSRCIDALCDVTNVFLPINVLILEKRGK